MSSSAKILVIDGDQATLRAMRTRLGTHFTVLTAGNGRDGLHIATNDLPDLILLHIRLPDGDGYEICRRIRATPELAQAKVLLMSGEERAFVRVKSYDAGADDHLTQPLDSDELLAKIRVYLRLRTVEEMERMKSGLLDLLAHEIRTPLTAILPATEMLSGDYVLSDDDRQMLLRALGDGARRLLRLTERACVLQRARAGGLELRCRNLDLADLLRAAIANARPVRVAICEQAAVSGDATLLTLAIEELINHASIHTDSAPVIELFAGEHDGMAKLRLSYAGDHATSHASRLVPTPLSPDVRDGQTVGAHLGLPTAEAILAAHGGDLWSVPGAAGLCGLEARLPLLCG